MTAYEAYIKATSARKRLPESELDIIQSASAYHAYLYARDVIEGRWLEAESLIIHSAYDACFYARDVIQGRWYEAETNIAQDAYSACCYSIDVIKDRWTEAESTIAKSNWKTHYIKEFFDEPVITKDEVDIIQWGRKNISGYYAPASLFKDQVSLLDMVME